jgi:hypothetical protein
MVLGRERTFGIIRITRMVPGKRLFCKQSRFTERRKSMNTAENHPDLSLPPSPEKLHEIAVKSYVIGNRLKRKFVMTVHALWCTKSYLLLGYSTITQYTEKEFGYQRSETYDILAVAEKLGSLPRSDKAFQAGTISWSALKEVARIATAETEGEWLSFAADHSLPQLKAEVKDAIKKGRNVPRKDQYGLPNLKVRMSFELEPHEHEIVTRALEKTAEEMGRSLGGGEGVEMKDILVFLARRALETDPARVEGRKSIYTILYHRCPDCRKNHVATKDGPVEISGEVVDLVEAEAHKRTITPEEEEAAVASGPVSQVERDRPNTPTIVTKVHLRDGGRCANPMCRRALGLHAHHLLFRANGGKTALWNEVLTCGICHALVHASLLKVEGNPATGLTWKPRCPDLKPGFEKELTELASVPDVRVVRESGCTDSESGCADSGAAGTKKKSGCPDSAVSGHPDCDSALARGLVKLGYSRKEAEERIEEAWKKLAGGPDKPREEEILLAALRM